MPATYPASQLESIRHLFTPIRLQRSPSLDLTTSQYEQGSTQPHHQYCRNGASGGHHECLENYSVVQSAFSSPCVPINTVMSNVTGFKSGFMPVSNTVPVFSIMVNDTKPIWAHCSQTGHCAKGMVMAINAYVPYFLF